MSLSLAQRCPWSLATTLMVGFVQADGGVMPTADFDGDPSTIVHDYDPWEIMDI